MKGFAYLALCPRVSFLSFRDELFNFIFSLFFFFREGVLAAIARRIYLQNGIGVGALKKMYGGSVNRGFAPSRFQTASGKIIRTALQELEKMGIIEKDESGGRRLTSKGQGEMDTQVAKIMSASS